MNRIRSIDTFRGFTIFMMVFVNDVAGAGNIPDWMKHACEDADTMTLADLVFPAFLMIVGMSIPLSIRTREARGDSLVSIFQHIAIRTISLLLLGLYMVNAEEMNLEANLLPPKVWNFLFYTAVILVWNQYPKSSNLKHLWQGLRLSGLVILAVLWFTFRKGESGALTGMTHAGGGVLDLIGWAYLLAALAYLTFRENTTVITVTLATFIAIAMGLKSQTMQLPWLLSWMEGQGGHFIHAALTLAGMLIALLFLDRVPFLNPSGRIRWMSAVSFFTSVSGYALRPLYGISKIRATPSWALFSIAVCCIVFALIYWIVDVKGIHKWADFLEPAGKNPLLTYLLPTFFLSVIGYRWMPEVFDSGLPGILKSVVFALFILVLANLLTRWKIKLQL